MNNSYEVWDEIAIKVRPVIVDGQTVIPEHYLIATDLHGNCSFGNACSTSLETAKGDGHVMQAIMSSLEGCGDDQACDCLDLGSNIGQMTAFMRSMGCSVVAVDPQKEVNRYFKGMVMANRWNDGSVVLHEVFLGETDGSREINRALWAPGGRIDHRKKRTVPEMSLQSLVTQKFRFTKVDMDAPEALFFKTLPAILKQRQGHTGNIMAEITISQWPYLFNISVSEGAAMIRQLQGFGYHFFLTAVEERFHEEAVMKKLQHIPRFRYFKNIYRIPPDLLEDVLNMMDRYTKNIFFGHGDDWAL